MNRKAVSTIMIIFEVIIVVTVVFMTTSAGKQLGEADTVRKINAAEDIRMMVDTLVGIPGDAIVKYPKNASEFAFILKPGHIAVFNEGEPENKWIIRDFFLPEVYTAEGISTHKEELCLEKRSSDRKILLRTCDEGEFP